MKNLLIILMLFSLTAHSQDLGDDINYLIDNSEEFNITNYYMGSHYIELVSTTDSLTTLYMIGFKTRKVYSIHYVYQDIESVSEALKTFIEGYIPLGNGVWGNDNTLITARHNNIILQDVSRRTKRIFRDRE